MDTEPCPAAAVSCICTARASVGDRCLEHAPIHLLRPEVLRLRATLSAKDDELGWLRDLRERLAGDHADDLDDCVECVRMCDCLPERVAEERE
jgi:hypothetical protein